MKKFATAKYFALSLLFLATAGRVVAGTRECYDTCYTEPACCTSTMSPWDECSWNLKFYAGVKPAIYTGRGDLVAVSAADVDSVPTAQFTTISKVPKFKDLFKNPGFIVGGEIGWSVDGCHEFYLDGNYGENKGRTFTVSQDVPGTTDSATLSFDFGKNRQGALYIGARRYWGRMWCDRLSLFFGAKVGFLHRRHIDADLTFNVPGEDVVTQTGARFVDRSTVVAGGVNFGFNYHFWQCMFLTVKGEVVAAGGPRASENVALTTPIPAFGTTNLIVGCTDAEVIFPVTFGLGWEF